MCFYFKLLAEQAASKETLEKKPNVYLLATLNYNHVKNI